MSFIIGRPRSVSVSCLVRSAIEMPVELEKKIENLDTVFHRQWAKFNDASNFITRALEHETMGNWQHISRMLFACQCRIKSITGDYVRASSYPSMRIMNTRMTDVLNVINPICGFIAFAIERCEIAKEQELKEARIKELELKKLEEERLKAPVEIELKKVEELEYKKFEIAEAPAPPDENSLLLEEEEKKENEYDGPPRRRTGGLWSCFGR